MVTQLFLRFGYLLVATIGHASTKVGDAYHQHQDKKYIEVMQSIEKKQREDDPGCPEEQ